MRTFGVSAFSVLAERRDEPVSDTIPSTLPDAPQTHAPIAPEQIEWRKLLAALPQEFDTRYVIGDALVAY